MISPFQETFSLNPVVSISQVRNGIRLCLAVPPTKSQNGPISPSLASNNTTFDPLISSESIDLLYEYRVRP